MVRRTPSSCSCVMIGSGLPTASSAVQPKIECAAGFQLLTVISRSTSMMASGQISTEGLEGPQCAGETVLAAAELQFLMLLLRNIGPGADDAAFAGALLADQQPMTIAAILFERSAGVEMPLHPRCDPFLGASGSIRMLARIDAAAQDILEPRAGHHPRPVLRIHPLVGLVGDDQAVIAIKQGEAGTDAFDRIAQARLRRLGPLLRPMPLGQGRGHQ